MKSAPRLGLWAAVSLALHVLLFLLLAEGRLEPEAPAAPPMWMEAVAPEPPVKEEPPPLPPPRKLAEPPKLALRATDEPQPAPDPAPALRAPVVEGPSSVAVEAGESGLGTSGASRAEQGVLGGTGTGEAGVPGEAERAQGPAQLALALEPAQLERIALVRPTIALLMAMPGYTDILRGSGIQPLSDLSRARLRVVGLAPERLTLAGVHVAGEAALVSAAERVAAMRAQAPEWRGDSDLRATSWVDGSGIDRGLAVQGGAFLIAARNALPRLLAGEGAVSRASQLRDRAFVDVWIEDAPRYLPGVEACALQALRVSFSEAGGEHRMLLTAQYRTGSAARAAAACWRAGPDAPWKTIASWLARADGSEGTFGVRLNLGVTSDDIQRLFDELAWALRSARRA